MLHNSESARSAMDSRESHSWWRCPHGCRHSSASWSIKTMSRLAEALILKTMTREVVIISGVAQRARDLHNKQPASWLYFCETFRGIKANVVHVCAPDRDSLSSSRWLDRFQPGRSADSSRLFDSFDKSDANSAICARCAQIASFDARF